MKQEDINQGLSRQNWLEEEQDISIKELLDKVVQYSPTGIAIHRKGKNSLCESICYGNHPGKGYSR